MNITASLEKLIENACRESIRGHQLIVRKQLRVLAVISFLLLASCKTCDCPAYSRAGQTDQSAQSCS